MRGEQRKQSEVMVAQPLPVLNIKKDMIKSIVLASCVIVIEIVLYFVYYQRI